MSMLEQNILFLRQPIIPRKTLLFLLGSFLKFALIIFTWYSEKNTGTYYWFNSHRNYNSNTISNSRWNSN